MIPKKVEVGSDILYHCNRCGLKLAHKVLAIVNHQPARIRCNTCKSERNYRLPSLKKERTPVRKRRTGIASPELYQKKMKESLMKTSKIYRMDMEVENGDIIQHPKFGKGVVSKLIPPDRMEVLFPSETKVLVCRCISASVGTET